MEKSENQNEDQFWLAKLGSGGYWAAAKGQRTGGQTGVLAPLIKRLLGGELDSYLVESQGNCRNGKGLKQLKTSHGAINLTPYLSSNSQHLIWQFFINYNL